MSVNERGMKSGGASVWKFYRGDLAPWGITSVTPEDSESSLVIDYIINGLVFVEGRIRKIMHLKHPADYGKFDNRRFEQRYGFQPGDHSYSPALTHSPTKKPMLKITTKAQS